MLRPRRYACFFSVVLLVFTAILVLNKPLFKMLVFQLTLPTEAADDVYSIELTMAKQTYALIISLNTISGQGFQIFPT